MYRWYSILFSFISYRKRDTILAQQCDFKVIYVCDCIYVADLARKCLHIFSILGFRISCNALWHLYSHFTVSVLNVIRECWEVSQLKVILIGAVTGHELLFQLLLCFWYFGPSVYWSNCSNAVFKLLAIFPETIVSFQYFSLPSKQWYDVTISWCHSTSYSIFCVWWTAPSMLMIISARHFDSQNVSRPLSAVYWNTFHAYQVYTKE